MRSLIENSKMVMQSGIAPDQDFGLKQGVMASFFGIQAATVTAHRRLMDISNAVAIPLYFTEAGIFEILNTMYW